MVKCVYEIKKVCETMKQIKKRFRATIGRKTYTILGDKATEHMVTVVALLNEQLQQVTEVAKTLSTEEKAVLLAINAVSKQIEQQQEINQLQETIAELKKQVTQLQRPIKHSGLGRGSELQFENELLQHDVSTVEVDK